MSHFESTPFGPRLVNPSFGGGRDNKLWRDLMVDEDLKDEWLERLNGIPGLFIRSVCAGGRDHSSETPLIFFNYGTTLHWTPEQRAEYARWGQQCLGNLGSIEVIDQSQEPIATIGFSVVAPKYRIYMSEQDFEAWWHKVIGRLEEFAKAHESLEG